jgi:hypothetical protein
VVHLPLQRVKKLQATLPDFQGTRKEPKQSQNQPVSGRHCPKKSPSPTEVVQIDPLPNMDCPGQIVKLADEISCLFIN